MVDFLVSELFCKMHLIFIISNHVLELNDLLLPSFDHLLDFLELEDFFEFVANGPILF